MTRGEASKLVTLLAAAFPRAGVTTATSEVYEAMLADLPYPEASEAVARLLRTSRFLPTIAEIREAAVELKRGALRSGAEAWGDVLKQIRRVGHVGVPKFQDPITAECVRILVWRNLAIEGTNDAADRARFCELYDDLARRDRVDEVAGLPPRAERAQLPENVRGLLGSIARELPVKQRGARQ